LIFSLNYSDGDFETVVQRFVMAATQMKNDGWWWHSPELTHKSIRRSILKETLFR
jgi:glutamate-1-semialdehyde 2,1-aminomutase